MSSSMQDCRFDVIVEAKVSLQAHCSSVGSRVQFQRSLGYDHASGVVSRGWNVMRRDPDRCT